MRVDTAMNASTYALKVTSSLLDARLVDMAKEATAALDKLDAWVTKEYPYHGGGLGAYEPLVATCGYCGGGWVHWPTTTHGGYTRRVPPKYCSNRCRRKANKQPSNIGHRLRKHGNAEAPRDAIHLSDLYVRDGGTCQICGEQTDWSDFTAKPDGTFWYINGRYPTIDHIVPIAKGGTHTWDNVQLAHRDCNSAKSDKVQEGSAA